MVVVRDCLWLLRGSLVAYYCKNFHPPPAQALREKYGIKDEMVLPYDLIEIINIPGYSSRSAEKACQELKVAFRVCSHGCMNG